MINGEAAHTNFIIFGLTRPGLEPSAVLTHGHTGQLPGAPMGIEAHANLCMLCTACFLMLKYNFVGSTNTINICLILSAI